MSAPLILMYHNICPVPATAVIKGMYVTPAQFDWQIRWLKRRGYELTTFNRLAAGTATCRSLVLTLDDGYANNYHHAFPILAKHRVPAVVYPIISELGRTGVTWPDATEQTPADMLTEAQISEMAAAGIEFGSHLTRHLRLTDLCAETQVEELVSSRRMLEAMTNAEVSSIAYPYGDYDAGVVARTKAAGYRYGLTTEPGVNQPQADPLRLQRFTARGCKLHHPMRFRRMLRLADREIRTTWPA